VKTLGCGFSVFSSVVLLCVIIICAQKMPGWKVVVVEGIARVNSGGLKFFSRFVLVLIHCLLFAISRRGAKRLWSEHRRESKASKEFFQQTAEV
jgi:hypothetical protein